MLSAEKKTPSQEKNEEILKNIPYFFTYAPSVNCTCAQQNL